jgi:Ca2+-binding EF-hand superfamily protein
MFESDVVDLVPDFQIGILEFGKVIRCLGHPITEKELAKLFAQIDTDGGNALEFVEFADVLSGPATHGRRIMSERITELRTLFNRVDTDGGGSISFDELSDIMQRLGRYIAGRYT